MNSRSQASNHPTRPSLDFLRTVPLFSELEPSALEDVANHLQFRAFGSGMTLFHQDMPGMTLYIMAEGFVRIYSIGKTGQEFTYYVYGASNIFGELSLLDNGFHSATCVTMTPIKTWLLSKENLFKLLSTYPSITTQMMSVLSRRVRAATQKSEVMAFQDVQGRLAYEILNLQESGGKQSSKDSAIEIPISQAELASMVGATRESVNKTLALFKAQNLIKISGSTITITDTQGLEKIIMERGR